MNLTADIIDELVVMQRSLFMRKLIPVDKLKIGMYVAMPDPWFYHPFMRNQFLIKSNKDIRKMVNFGLKKVIVDFSKSEIDDKELIEPTYTDAPLKFDPMKLIPLEMRKSIRDKNIVPEKRASIIKSCSKEIMKSLFDAPIPENVHQAKECLYEIVDCILADDEIADYLMKITDHDLYTYTHSVNVGILSLLLAKSYLRPSSNHDLRELGAGFFLHDIGKTRINQTILNKRGRLTDEEMSEVQSHPQRGFDILKESDHVSDESKIITLQHHEKEDGSGYPQGLRGDEIHIYARICSLVDVYDALTCDRPYRKKLTPFQALKLIKRQILGQIQWNLFEHFVVMLGEDDRCLNFDNLLLKDFSTFQQDYGRKKLKEKSLISESPSLF
jgi:HD-GYP domain-containing protein (c-di-GMP phosphodiesterase class II)